MEVDTPEKHEIKSLDLVKSRLICLANLIQRLAT